MRRTSRESVEWRVGLALLGVLLFAAMAFGAAGILWVLVDVARDLGLLDGT